MVLGDFQNTALQNAATAEFFGNEAAKVADPYGYQRRTKAADSFDRLLAHPGAINSSPFYKYLTERAMAATRAGNAAGGFRNSGRGLMALQDAAQGAATKAFFPLAELYGKASGALNPFSPLAAGYMLRGADSASGYRDAAALAKNLASRQTPGSGGGLPWWMQPMSSSSGGTVPGTGLPTGGASYMPSSYDTGWMELMDPRSDDPSFRPEGYNFAPVTLADIAQGVPETDFGISDFGMEDY